MPILGFKAQFAPLVESGQKRQTIRAPRAKPIKVGDTLYLAEGVRTKKYRQLGQPQTCKSVQRVVIELEAKDSYRLFIDGRHVKDLKECMAFAAADGFPWFSSFGAFFVDERKPRFEGDLIKW